jgi:D-sedoheptulose 7-phosphate isomerase
LSELFYATYRQKITRGLENLQISASPGGILSHEEGLSMAVRWAWEILNNNGVIYFCGNGASAAMASHMSIDWLKCAGIRSLCFNDSASLTAIGNDVGYAEVFSLPLTRLAGSRDLLVTISSSGNSPNVVKALETAKQMGVRSVSFSGFDPKNRSRSLADLNFYVPTSTYGLTESCHQVILHAWLDLYISLHSQPKE